MYCNHLQPRSQFKMNIFRTDIWNNLSAPSQLITKKLPLNNYQPPIMFRKNLFSTTPSRIFCKNLLQYPCRFRMKFVFALNRNLDRNNHVASSRFVTKKLPKTVPTMYGKNRLCLSRFEMSLYINIVFGICAKSYFNTKKY